MTRVRTTRKTRPGLLDAASGCGRALGLATGGRFGVGASCQLKARPAKASNQGSSCG